MSNKFANIPLDSDTTILEEKPITLEGLEAFYQKWRWDGITAESVIFASADINHLDDSELELEWLDKNLIAWTECDTSRYQGPILYLTYEGSIYIDIPYDLKNETYLKIQDYLEKSDGKMKDPDVILWYLPLERAIPNLRN